MTWILVLLMSTGAIKKHKFNSLEACEQVKNEIVSKSNLPKLQSAFCVNDKKK